MSTLKVLIPPGTFRDAANGVPKSGSISLLPVTTDGRPITCRSGDTQILSKPFQAPLVDGGLPGGETCVVPNPADSDPLNIRYRIEVVARDGDSAYPGGVKTVYPHALPVDNGNGEWDLSKANLSADQPGVLVDLRKGEQGAQGYPGDASHILLTAAFAAAGTQVLAHHLGTMFPACSLYYVSGITGGVTVTPIDRDRIRVTAPGQVLLVIACTGGNREATSGLIRNWPMNEGFGSVSLDTVGANVLSYNSAPGWAGLNTPAYPTFGVVPVFPLGDPSGATTADAYQLAFERSDSFSFMAWLYLDDPSATQYILHALNASSVGYGFYVSGRTLRLQLISSIPNSDFAEYSTDAVVPQGAATHVGLSYDGSTATCAFYVNGQRVSGTKNGNLTGSLVSGVPDIGVGSARGGDQAVRQIVARVRIYNTVAGDAEFAARFTNRD